MAQAVRTNNKPTRNDDKSSARWIGYLLGGLGSAFFATKSIVIKLALIENVDAVTTLTWRMLIAVPFFALIGWMGYRDRRTKDSTFTISRPTLIKSAAIGLVGYYLASYLDFVGLKYVTAQLNRLIMLTYPFFVLIFGAMFFGRRISLSMVVGLVVSYTGLTLIFAHDLALDGPQVIMGSLLVLSAAMAYAFYQLVAKPLIDEIGARLFTSIAMSTAGLAVIVHFLLTHQLDDLQVSGKAMWLMLAMGTISTVLPAYLLSAAIGYVGPASTAMMGNVSPLVTIVLAVTVLGEIFSIWHAAGAALVLIGIIGFTRANMKKPPP
jgi:drug/metabolite transporter (DMT)-like permease